MTTTAEPRTPTPASAPAASVTAQLERRRRSIAFGLLVSAQLVVMLDTSIVNVALPSIQADLALSPAALTWVVNAYVLTFGGLLLLSGRAADLFGRRRMFTAGSVLFTAGTLLAAAASNEQMLVAGRIIQGAGAASLSPAAMSLLLLTFPGPARAKAMSAWGAASAVGGATGVFLGGILTGTFGWSAVFLVTVPFSLASIVLARRVLDETATGTRHRFDAPGAAAITGAVIALVHGALGAADGQWTSTSVLASFAASAALTAAFIHIERRTAEPLVPLELFRSRVLSTGVGLAVLGGAARASSFVLVALYLQQALAHGSPAGRPVDGPHLRDWVRRLPGPPPASAAGTGATSHPRRRSRHPRRRAPVAGLRTPRGRIPRRRPAGTAPGRSRSSAQLHPHHHGHRLLSPRDAHRPGVRARRFSDPGRRGAGHGRLHRHRYRRQRVSRLRRDAQHLRVHRRLHRRSRGRPRHSRAGLHHRSKQELRALATRKSPLLGTSCSGWGASGVLGCSRDCAPSSAASWWGWGWWLLWAPGAPTDLAG